MEEAIGSRAIAGHYRSLVPRLKQAAYDTFWVADRGLLARNRDRKDFDEHSNVLGILADVIPQAKQRAALEYTISHWDELPRVHQAKSSFFFFLLPARSHGEDRTGRTASWRCWRRGSVRWIGLHDIRRIGHGRATLGQPRLELRAECPRVFTAGRHSTSGPGYRAVSIRPHLNGLPWLKATAPHPDGEIDVSLKARPNGGLEADVSLPEGIGGWFEWGGRTIALHGGKQSLVSEPT